MKHIEQIKYHMRIDMIESNSSPWAYHPARSSGEEGAQIDLLIDRQDTVINICEMKFSRSAFSIDAAYARDLRRKTEVFRRQTGTKKNLFLTMITTFGLNQNSHSISLNAIDVRMEALFEKISESRSITHPGQRTHVQILTFPFSIRLKTRTWPTTSTGWVKNSILSATAPGSCGRGS